MLKIRKSKFLTILFSLILVLSIYHGNNIEKVYAASSYVNKVYMDKSRYNPGDKVTIYADLSNTSGTNFTGTLYMEIAHNEISVYTTSQSITLNNGQSVTKSFQWTAPSTDYQGYIVKVYTESGDYKTGAVDVSSNWTKFPRYGYIPDFDSNITQSNTTKQINTLSQDYNINAFQFYDWMWRHEVPIKKSDGVNPDSSWTDLFSRNISYSTIQNYIKAVHNNNGKAMAYMMSYAAREGYTDYGVNPSWGLFQDTSHQSQLNVNFNNGKYLWLFAPSNTSWQNYIGNIYKDVVNTAGFDGIQMDQMGQRDGIYDYNGKSYDLGTSFSSLINSVKRQLNSNNSLKSYLDFNIVDGTTNGWALDDVSKNADTDFNFSEIWWKSNNYNDIRNYVEQLRSNSNKKAAVLAAYMNYNENLGPKYEAENASFNGVDIAVNHSGYSGSGFLQNFAQQGDYVQFTVNVNETMNYPLVFQYGDNLDNATRTIYIDGNKVGQVQFHPQGTWDKFVYDANLNVNLTKGNHTIKISYDSGDTGAINLDSLTLGEFDEHSVRLADAAFEASGATHIELGAGKDDTVMLPHEYYPNTSKAMTGTLKAAMKQNYKFITAYENLLFDQNINYGDQGNQYININGEKISGDGTEGSIWHMTRMTKDYDILHLINLSNETDSKWRNSTSSPIVKNNLSVKYYFPTDTAISNVYLASPDFNEGTSTALKYTTGTDNIGKYVSFTVPTLDYWDMIYIKRAVNTPNNDQYEAENAIKTSVTTNTDHTGYTGTGFIDGFAEKGDEITTEINADAAGDHSLIFRYGNSTGTEATRHVYVDGSYVGILHMPNLSNWDTWSKASLNVNLAAGVHTICIYYASTDNGGVNLDNLTVK
ncbi:glycoside hydrolase family 66 protein [Clostridium oryzae]|uniref:Cycloisomaltooligosaccharide glucanotransferase n=1 Tax=Clostridium oryzae TaxID=1450648 RepID=A0A1V4IYX2_9CLOT|nr:glycoside hydrolase family 66 protein [Clostridium oryzae]OPJ65252.1 cycloisomaltooligosaccharide glucanotransferase precursor [Clostridium oryzae]